MNGEEYSAQENREFARVGADTHMEGYRVEIGENESMLNVEEPDPQQYDLEERTFRFARDTRAFIKVLPKTLANVEDCRQLVKASGSTGANYIEAREAISRRDFAHRVSICRKESKESHYSLRLVDTCDTGPVEQKRKQLVQEAFELTRIFSAMHRKTQG